MVEGRLHIGKWVEFWPAVCINSSLLKHLEHSCKSTTLGAELYKPLSHCMARDAQPLHPVPPQSAALQNYVRNLFPSPYLLLSGQIPVSSWGDSDFPGLSGPWPEEKTLSIPTSSFFQQLDMVSVAKSALVRRLGEKPFVPCSVWP